MTTDILSAIVRQLVNRAEVNLDKQYCQNLMRGASIHVHKSSKTNIMKLAVSRIGVVPSNAELAIVANCIPDRYIRPKPDMFFRKDDPDTGRIYMAVVLTRGDVK